jgi:hypothetical protein
MRSSSIIKRVCRTHATQPRASAGTRRILQRYRVHDDSDSLTPGEETASNRALSSVAFDLFATVPKRLAAPHGGDLDALTFCRMCAATRRQTTTSSASESACHVRVARLVCPEHSSLCRLLRRWAVARRSQRILTRRARSPSPQGAASLLSGFHVVGVRISLTRVLRVFVRSHLPWIVSIVWQGSPPQLIGARP